MSSSSIHFGHLIEGVLERDSGGFVIRTIDSQGRQVCHSVQEILSSLEGQEVRLTLASLENLSKLAKIVEEQGEQVVGVYPEDLPEVPFNIVRKDS